MTLLVAYSVGGAAMVGFAAMANRWAGVASVVLLSVPLGVLWAAKLSV